ncbi:hypothetical protein ATCC90586_005520 [Pythium insidiosum]|nr:hypothetical protein ATCC90586_005520 [Pythium insidiosum]
MTTSSALQPVAPTDSAGLGQSAKPNRLHTSVSDAIASDNQQGTQRKRVQWSTITVHEFGVGLGGSTVSERGGPSIGLADKPEFTWTTNVGEMAECSEGIHRFSPEQRTRLLKTAGVPDAIISRYSRETNIILRSRRRTILEDAIESSEDEDEVETEDDDSDNGDGDDPYHSVCRKRKADSQHSMYGASKPQITMDPSELLVSPAMGALGLSTVDLSLCGLYLVSVLGVGLFFTLREQRERVRQQAQAKLGQGGGDEVLEEYYLGGRRIPWWALAVADVSSYIDISGTMINTALIYALGIKGMYIEIRGGMCLFLAFQLAFTGKLSRRCPVKTRGEWIKFRFGDRREGVLLRTTIALTSLISGIFAVTYFAVGGGKFVTEFVAFPSWWGLPSEFWAAALLMVIALLYTVAAGFTTVVYTDVYQSIFIFSTFLVVGVMGAMVNLPSSFTVFLPQKSENGASSMVPWNVTRSEWLFAGTRSSLHLPSSTSYAMYDSFDVIVFTYLAIQCMRSASGPGGSGLQTVLATKSEKEVRSQTFLAMLLLALRWAFSGGIAVMAIQYTVHHAGVVIDPERVVPVVIDKMLPDGLKGFVLASLLAAAMTTFDTTINSTSSYWTVDIYQALLRPDASEKQLLWHARVSTFIIMILGLLLSLHVHTINRIWGFMTIAMAGAFIWPFFFSWYWARFNAYGYLCGVLSGFIAAMTIFIFTPLLSELQSFLITSSISCIVSLVVTLTTRGSPSQVVRRFYRFARPPGAWGQIKDVCFTRSEISDIDRENRADLACTVLIAVAQVALYVLSVSVVAKAWVQVGVLSAVLVCVSPWIYFKWYLHLQDRPVGLRASDLRAQLLD